MIASGVFLFIYFRNPRLEFKDLSLEFPKGFEPKLVSVADDEKSAYFYEPNTDTNITVTIEETRYSIENIAEEVFDKMTEKKEGAYWLPISVTTTYDGNCIYGRKVKKPDEYYEIIALYRMNRYDLYTVTFISPPDTDDILLGKIISKLMKQY
ncbi:MAG: hypothetical protein Q4D13_02205 [Erysipelotrichaceae bacterium]|nr:hypothetical protein [Erysipelotrichaceae bacterium]